MTSQVTKYIKESQYKIDDLKMKSFICLFSFILSLLISYCSAEVLSSGKEVEAFVDENIASANVVVFGKTFCRFCKKSFDLLKSVREEIPGWTLKYVELDNLPDDDGPLVEMELLKITGQKGVPNVFIEGYSIVGYTEMRNLYDTGDLQEMLLGINAVQY